MYTLNRTCAGRSPSFKFNAHILLLCPKNLWHHILSLCLCFFNQIFSWACHHGNKLPIQTTIPHRHQQNQTRIQHRNSFLVFLLCCCNTKLYSESQSALGGIPPVIRLPGFHIRLHQTHVLATNKPFVTWSPWAPCFTSDNCLGFDSLCFTQELSEL